MSHNFKGRLRPPFFFTVLEIFLESNKRILEVVMIDQRFKEALAKDLRVEIKKGEEMIMADLLGKRVSKRFNEIMQEKMNEIAQITDSQVLLASTISLLRDSASVLDSVISEANVTRREQQAKAEAVKECYDKFVQLEKQIKEEEEASKKEAAEKEAKEAQKENLQEEEAQQTQSQQIRKIGERPEKLRDVRNSSHENQGRNPGFLSRQ